MSDPTPEEQREFAEQQFLQTAMIQAAYDVDRHFRTHPSMTREQWTEIKKEAAAHVMAQIKKNEPDAPTG